MIKRNLTALVLIAVALFFLLYLRTFYVAYVDILFYAFMLFGTYEMIRVGKSRGYQALLIPLIAYALAFLPLFHFYRLTGVTLALMLSLMIAFGDFLFARRSRTLHDFFYTIFVLFYPMLLCSTFFYINHEAGNLLGIFYLLFVTLLSDAFALFAGVLFGKKKLIEDVSPKKTVAGAIGAYVGGMLGAGITLLFFDGFRVFKNFNNVGLIRIFDHLYISIPVYLSFAIVCTTLAIFGDLAASLIKRKMGIKDFGKIFPGHGGVMDRLDSLLFVAPAVALFFTIYNGVVGV